MPMGAICGLPHSESAVYFESTPAGTPAAIVRQLNAEIIKAISQPDIRERISKLGASPVTETPEEFAAFIAAERRRLGDVIIKTGIVLAD